MTASLYLKKRKEEIEYWAIPKLPGNTLGGWEDSYVHTFSECTPEFYAIPIGHKDGAKVCVRRTAPGQGGQRINDSQVIYDKQKAFEQKMNGYHRAAPNLYNPTLQRPVQKWNPQDFSDRRMPHEQDYLKEDYVKWPIRYNSTGIKELHAPRDGPYKGKMFQYGFSSLNENNRGLGGDWDTYSPIPSQPPKYDITRLHQAYPVWHHEQSIMREKQPRVLH